MRLTYERRLTLLAASIGLPGSLCALGLLWAGDYSPKVRWTLVTFIATGWFILAAAVRARVITPLQTLSNLLAALREGDYSIRARDAGGDDALGEVALEINALGETLRSQRLGAVEATALLRTVMEEISLPIVAFDAQHRLRLSNRAAERLLGLGADQLRGRDAADLNLEDCLAGDASRIVEKAFPDGAGASSPRTLKRFDMRRSTFREGGVPHYLIVLTDLSRALREEERLAWQRLIRVLGHELNNSMAPIRSIAGSLATLLARDPLPDDWREDIQRGVAVIGSRSESLGRFMEGYARLARLPSPARRRVDLAPLLRRVAGLETRLRVTIEPGPDLTLQADPDQLEQLLINVVRNAVDASLETGGGVRIGWSAGPRDVELVVADEGPGLPPSANLFVPFFTTKPGGTGIGLVLSRQIAEAHGGTLNLAARQDGRGCEARLRLPIT